MSEAAGIVKLTDDTFHAEVAKTTTLVDFTAEWCGPCRMIKPELEEVAKQQEKVTVAMVDIDACQNTAAEFKVTSVPTLILFKDGKEAKRMVGLKDAAGIIEFINE